MSNSSHAKSIFLNALQHEVSTERRKYIVAACGSDPELMQEVESLLESYTEDDLGRAFQAACGIEADMLEGGGAIQNERIGPYQVREQIGEGGMGVVYVAEQTEPVQRKVAIKVIKPGMDTKEVIARFEAERQALAFMEHPNIARVLDAGATESGRSYFVMELVRGIPITEYCDQVKATPRERLELFQTVCDAVQHAHQKGIIHRDIKPSNVLVTQVSAKPVVKVIDFGLAKAVSGQRLTKKTLYTGFMKLMGTPAYMSPEQAGLSGLDIDTRSDIYSLGVLLYELLTGTTPLDKTEIKQQAYDELCRQIREVVAPKPSTRFSTLKDAERSTIAQQRQIQPRELRQLLHGDLDLVVLKAIEKDRDRRYGSPQDLAADIDRFLEDKPVLAVPPSQLYLAQKYLRRHKAAILTAVTILLLLIVATLFSSWQAIRATSASKTAREKTTAAELSEHAALTAKREAETAREAALVSQRHAEQSDELRRRLLYASNMQLADQLWHSEHGTGAQIHNLLIDWIQEPERDLRDFSWRFQWTRLHHSQVKNFQETQAVAFSSNGSLLIADGQGVREWEATAQEFTLRLPAESIEGFEVESISPCGRWVALKSIPVLHNDRFTIRLVRLDTGVVIQELPGHRTKFSANGDVVFVWDGYTDLREHQIWNLTTETRVSESDELMNFLSSSNGARLQSISGDGKSVLLTIKTTLRGFLNGKRFSRVYEPYVLSAAFSHDGKLMADGQYGGDVYVRLADAPGNALLLNAPSMDAVSSLAFSADSQQLAVAGQNGMIWIWDISDAHDLGNAEPGSTTKGKHNDEADPDNVMGDRVVRVSTSKVIRTLKGHLAHVSSVAFSPNAAKVVSRELEGVTKLWSSDDALIEDATQEAEDLFGSTPNLEIEMHADGMRVSYVGNDPSSIVDGEIHPGDRIVAVTNETGYQTLGSRLDQIPEEEDTVYAVLSGPHGTDVTVHLQSSEESEQRVVRLRRNVRHVSGPSGLIYSKDGGSIFVADYEQGVTELNASGRARGRLPIRGSALAISPTGEYLAIDDFNKLVLWNLREDRVHSQWDARVDAVPVPYAGWGGTMEFSPNGKFIALGTGFAGNGLPKRSDLRVWEIETKREIGGAPLLKADSGFCDIVFAPSGDQMFTAQHDGSMCVWDTLTWKQTQDHNLPVSQLMAIAISPDGATLATGGAGLVLWDTTTKSVLHMIPDVDLWDLAFSSYGKTLVATAQKEVVLVDVQSGQRLGTLPGHLGFVSSCDFSPDNQTLATIDVTGGLRFWKARSLADIDNDAMTLQSMLERGRSLINGKNYLAAERTLRRALRMQTRVLPRGHPDSAVTRRQLVTAIRGQGKLPTITGQPKSQMVELGTSLKLSVACKIPEYTNEVTYQWFLAGNAIKNATQPTLFIPNVSSDDLGVYDVEIRSSDVDLGTVVVKSEASYLYDKAATFVRGGLKKEFYSNIEGGKLADLKASSNYPDRPDSIGATAGFEIPKDVDDQYGLRLTGYLIPPTTGEYVFYVCSDGSSELFLSVDHSPANSRPIARLNGWHAHGAWETLEPENISEPIRLEAGKRYWVEAQYKEGGGGDHFAVTWQMPDKPPPKQGAPPIAGKYLELQIE